MSTISIQSEVDVAGGPDGIANTIALPHPMTLVQSSPCEGPASRDTGADSRALVAQISAAVEPRTSARINWREVIHGSTPKNGAPTSEYGGR